ncbi:hypothetical protein CRG98_013821 [Punica granatum]|uniref:Uncharacterized protein n=1 Tax=Punica granatum TaxID=22663 RepID=A0A2I0KB39_PUNGR|nr:hypothetical protein CRG98_013821 [Punica granatum]
MTAHEPLMAHIWISLVNGIGDCSWSCTAEKEEGEVGEVVRHSATTAQGESLEASKVSSTHAWGSGDRWLHRPFLSPGLFSRFTRESSGRESGDGDSPLVSTTPDEVSALILCFLRRRLDESESVPAQLTGAMSLLRRVDMMELDPFCPAFPFLAETSIFVPTTTIASPSFLKDPLDVCFALDHLSPQPEAFEFFDALTDLIQAEKPAPVWSYGRIRRRVGADSYLQTLCDRVEVLGSRFDRLHNAGMTGGRKYTWTAEVEGRHADRKYKWVAEINQGKEEKKKHYHHHHHNLKGGKSYKWTAEIKEKGEDGPIKRTYTWKSSTGDGAYHCKPLKGKKKEEKKLKKGECATRLVEIEELNHHGAVVLRQAFAKRTGVAQRARGKKKELSPQDAASMIQMSFKAYLLRRSQALRALREARSLGDKCMLVVMSFNMALSSQGVDLMVRAAKKSMTDELEAMLDVVDPQPLDKYLAIRRRRMFDVPDGHVKKEVADGVAQIVRMLDQDEKSTTSTSEV